jgi:hypothetical protein
MREFIIYEVTAKRVQCDDLTSKSMALFLDIHEVVEDLGTMARMIGSLRPNQTPFSLWEEIR